MNLPKKTIRLALMLALLLVGTMILTACGSDDSADLEGEASEVVVDDANTEGVETEADEVAETEAEAEAVTETEAEADAEEMAETDSEEIMTESQALDTTMGMTGMSGAEGMLLRASILDDYDFINQDGEISGEIDDFLVDVSTGQILFAFAEYGGFLDIGDTNIIVPLSALQWGEEELVLNFAEQELEQFPNVGEDWPNLDDPTWDDELNTFWRNINIEPGFDFDETNSANVMRLSDMTGYSLVDLGEGLGTIHDVLIDLTQSRIKYVLFDFGTAAVGDDEYIVPYSAIDIENIGENEFTFDANIDMDVLKTAPRFDRNLYPETEVLTDENFGAEINEFWAELGFEIN